MQGRAGGRLVVTGGAGFIGSHLIDRLLDEASAEIVAFDDLSGGRLSSLDRHRADPRLSVVRGDVRDYDAVERALRGADFAYHLAGRRRARGGLRDVDDLFAANVLGTFNLLRAAARHSVRLIFTSSRHVYGEPIILPVDEDQPLMTVEPYGASKVAGEAFCRAFRRAYGVQVVVLRLGNVYGPRESDGVVSTWLGRALTGRDLPVYGGKQVLDFLCVRRTVEAIVQASALGGAVPPINVASGTGTPLLDLARRIVRLTGNRSQVRLMPAPASTVSRFVANVDRMAQLLAITPPLDPMHHLDTMLGPRVEVAS